MFKFETNPTFVEPNILKPKSKEYMESEQITHLIQMSFSDVDTDKKCNVHIKNRNNEKSFWSKIYQVDLLWKDEYYRNYYPKSVFVKLPIISENVTKNSDTNKETIEELQQTLITITRNENTFIRMINQEKIAYFPTVYSYYVEDLTEQLQGGMVSKSLFGKAFSADYIPGLNEKQALRIMDALAGLHHWSIVNTAVWKPIFGKMETIDQGTAELFYDEVMNLEAIKPEWFKNRISPMKWSYTEKFAKTSQLDTLGLSPVLVHYDLNVTNILWQDNSESDNLEAIIDFQFIHSGRISEDILRILQIGIPPELRKENKDKFLRRYHSTLSELFNGEPPFSLDDVRRNYDATYLYASQFSLFGVVNYYKMYDSDSVEKCPNRREHNQAKLLEIAKSIVDEIYEMKLDKQNGYCC